MLILNYDLYPKDSRFELALLYVNYHSALVRYLDAQRYRHPKSIDAEPTRNLERRMPEVFEVYVKTHFSAAHRLAGYPGDCSKVHGHNWMVEAYIKCYKLDEIGIGVDFRDIKDSVGKVLSGLDHSDLNEIEPFTKINPSSENIAKHLYQKLSAKLNSDTIKVSKVKVCETPGAGAYYYVED